MRGHSVLLLIVLGCAALAPGFAQEASESPIFRSGVNVVSLTVAVMDGQDRYVTGLSKDDFIVREDGVPQEVAFFAEGEVPLDLAILLDVSDSMRDKLPLAQDAASGLSRILRPVDRGAAVEFGDSARFLTGFTSDREELETGIRSAVAEGKTALYNALYVTLAEFERLPHLGSDPRRQAVVVLSDGEDTASLVEADRVIERAKRAGVRIYTVSLVSAHRQGYERRSGYSSAADQAMTMLARDSGARSYFPKDATELPAVYAAIGNEIEHLYLMGYTSSNTSQDGSFRSISVQVTQPNAFARTRTGYFAPESRPRSIAFRSPAGNAQQAASSTP